MALEEALTIRPTYGERYWEAELYRLKGQLTLQQFRVLPVSEVDFCLASLFSPLAWWWVLSRLGSGASRPRQASAIPCPVSSSSRTLPVIRCGDPERSGQETTGRRAPESRGRRSAEGAERTQCGERRGSAKPGQESDLLLLAAVCVTRSAAEAQTPQGPGDWREAEEAQASLSGRDVQRWEGPRGWGASKSITWSAGSHWVSIVQGEAASARTWAAGGRCLAGRDAGGRSARGVSGGRAVSGGWARTVVAAPAGQRDAAGG